MDFLGFIEILLIIILIFLASEPDKMVQMAKNIGRVARQIKQTATEFISSLTKEVEEVKGIKKEMANSIEDER